MQAAWATGEPDAHRSTLLAVISGVVALITVVFLKNAIIALAPADIPRLNEIDVSAKGLFFAFLISVFTGVLFGLALRFRLRTLTRLKASEKADAGRA